jgi:hypothetical protein
MHGSQAASPVASGDYDAAGCCVLVRARACAPTRVLGSSASRGVRVRAGTAEKFRVRRLAPGVVACVLLSGLLVGSGTASPAVPQGCHGAATVAYKQATNDPGSQVSAIGEQGNSDDNPFNGQAHSTWPDHVSPRIPHHAPMQKCALSGPDLASGPPESPMLCNPVPCF